MAKAYNVSAVLAKSLQLQPCEPSVCDQGVKTLSTGQGLSIKSFCTSSLALLIAAADWYPGPNSIISIFAIWVKYFCLAKKRKQIRNEIAILYYKCTNYSIWTGGLSILQVWCLHRSISFANTCKRIHYSIDSKKYTSSVSPECLH